MSLQRERCASDPVLVQSVAQVKSYQARRFAASYADLLANESYRDAARFFLDELYGDKDFRQRDQQFARIAGALQRVFPGEVVDAAVAIAELHALTERLDLAMGKAWMRLACSTGQSDASRYVQVWRETGGREDRMTQLREVLELGQEMEKLTHTPGLRLMLRMMRTPAGAAGLGDLQRFLESGFDNFASMAKKGGLASVFLGTIETRESKWITLLFDADPVACATQLETALGQAR